MIQYDVIELKYRGRDCLQRDFHSTHTTKPEGDGRYREDFYFYLGETEIGYALYYVDTARGRIEEVMFDPMFQLSGRGNRSGMGIGTLAHIEVLLMTMDDPVFRYHGVEDYDICHVTKISEDRLGHLNAMGFPIQDLNGKWKAHDYLSQSMDFAMRKKGFSFENHHERAYNR